MYVCKDKDDFNLIKAKEKLTRSLSRNFYAEYREWPYKMVKPQIMAEQYMEDSETHELNDYKFFCFNGKVKFFKIDFDRFLNHRANYYDRKGNLLSFGEAICPPDFERNLKIPEALDEMITLAETLSKHEIFVRVDLYYCNKKIYFGELTYYPASGLGRFIPAEWDERLGIEMKLPFGGYHNMI